ncbi:MAG: hypothetical protein LBR24_00600 [Methanobrevibacter sp.]|nr:hypothetical protein [Methanobrevibacter sp.]
MKINKYLITGLVFIAVSVVLFFSDGLDFIIRPVTWFLLMGSSKGKDIIFFGLLGLFFILNGLLSRFIHSLPKSKDFYLKLSLLILFFGLGLCLILEILMRMNLGLDVFTIFVVSGNEYTTTSLIHTHIFKSVVGNFISSSLTVHSGIFTASSLLYYVPKIAYSIVVILPLLFICSFLSLKQRLAPSKVILILSSTLAIIGLIDGGLFAVPTIIGIYGLLVVLFDEKYLDFIFGKIFNNKHILEISTKRLKTYYKNRRKKGNYSRIKRAIPHIALVLIIVLRISLAIVGTHEGAYELNVIEPTVSPEDLNTSLSSYNISNYSSNDTQLNFTIDSKTREDKLLYDLSYALRNKCKVFTLSWNFYSYL